MLFRKISALDMKFILQSVRNSQRYVWKEQLANTNVTPVYVSAYLDSELKHETILVRRQRCILHRVQTTRTLLLISHWLTSQRVQPTFLVCKAQPFLNCDFRTCCQASGYNLPSFLEVICLCQNSGSCILYRPVRRKSRSRLACFHKRLKRQTRHGQTDSMVATEQVALSWPKVSAHKQIIIVRFQLLCNYCLDHVKLLEDCCSFST